MSKHLDWFDSLDVDALVHNPTQHAQGWSATTRRPGVYFPSAYYLQEMNPDEAQDS